MPRWAKRLKLLTFVDFKSKMKRFSFVILVLTLAIVVVGCNKKEVEEVDVRIFGVAETGLVIDVTDRNGGQATTTPGDVIYIKLTGEADSGKQWFVTAPTSGSNIMLKDHVVTGLVDAELEEFTDEWSIKVEEKGEFSLKFAYGATPEEPEDTFEIKVISQ